MLATYTTKDASELTRASKQAIRVYTQKYARYMSTEATPDAGAERRFTEADLKLLAYIYQQTNRSGNTHDKVLAQLAAGELDAYEWEVPIEPTGAPMDAESHSTALVPVERLVAIQALLQAEREERQRAMEREDELQEKLDRVQGELNGRINQLERELGKTAGELSAVRSQRRKPPVWWVRLFGGGE